MSRALAVSALLLLAACDRLLGLGAGGRDVQPLDGRLLDGPAPHEGSPAADAGRTDWRAPDRRAPDALPDKLSTPDKVAAKPDASAGKPQLLVSVDNNLQRCQLDGTPVGGATNIPYPGPRPPTESARDLVVLPSGEVAIYNGTFSPFLTVGASLAGPFSHYTYAGWSTSNSVSDGGIAAAAGFIFVTDMDTSPQTGVRGVVRFDSAFKPAHFPTAHDLIDLTVGLDGKLYVTAQDERTIYVFEPSTMKPLLQIVLTSYVRAVTANAAGELFAASWDGNLYRFSSAGAFQKKLFAGMNLGDIDLGYGVVVAGRWSGDVVVTDESLTAISKTFHVGSGLPFVALVPPN